jgi:hypothetical protein
MELRIDTFLQKSIHYELRLGTKYERALWVQIYGRKRTYSTTIFTKNSYRSLMVWVLREEYRRFDNSKLGQEPSDLIAYQYKEESKNL